MTIQIIGAGMARTGTLSTKQALEELGFSRCCHQVGDVESASHTVHSPRLVRSSPDWPSAASPVHIGGRIRASIGTIATADQEYAAGLWKPGEVIADFHDRLYSRGRPRYSIGNVADVARARSRLREIGADSPGGSADAAG